MSSHASTAAAVRKRKAAHPADYCQADPKCLWNVSTGKPCGRHPVAAAVVHGCGATIAECDRVGCEASVAKDGPR